MAYADYEYYVNSYKGNAVSEADFDRYAERATSYLDWLPANRITGVTDNVKNAACAVAETIQLNDNGGGIAAQTVGKWSVSYVAGTVKAKTDEERLYQAARLYLEHTGLLNRWC